MGIQPKYSALADKVEKKYRNVVLRYISREKGLPPKKISIHKPHIEHLITLQFLPYPPVYSGLVYLVLHLKIDL